MGTGSADHIIRGVLHVSQTYLLIKEGCQLAKTKKTTTTKKKPGRPPGSKNKKSEADPAKEEAAKAEIKEMQEKRKASKMVNDVIWGIVYMAIGAFIFIAVQFNAAGEFGNKMGDFLKGIFGLIGLVLPWYLILIGLLLIAHKAMHFSSKTLFFSILMLLMLCLLNSGRFIDSGHLVYALKTFYSDGVTLDGGGAFGMMLGVLLVKLIGKAGLYILSGVVTLICILLIINTPLSKAMENHKNKREEKRLLREMAAEESQAAEEKVFQEEEPASVSAPVKAIEDEPKHDIKIITPFDADETIDKLSRSIPEEPVLPFQSEEPEAAAPARKSNVLDFMKSNDPFADTGSRSSSGTSYGLEGSLEDQLFNDSEPEPVKPSAKEIAREAAEIGSGLGLAGAAAALTKAVDRKSGGKYRKPPIDLLDAPDKINQSGLSVDLKEKARMLEETLQNFNVDAKVVQVTQGPAITRYEIQPNVGVKVSSIVRLSDDIALNLRAKSIRIEAPIPGKAAVGIEVENDKINMVRIREIIDSREFKSAKSKIEFAVGKDIAGKSIVADLKGMPHLLIAGSTGSGKSVCINSIITSILYKADPDEVKLVLIDPKVVELGNYNGIPHLLIPVVTDPSKAAAALSWAVVEMTNRYKMFAEAGVRDLESYNNKMTADKTKDLIMPQVVIIIDELADLMMAAPSQVEESICRLAQMARAAGMHLIVATQRPSVDIITGVIKANIPSRIAFAVSSQFDSRTILDMAGAEKLVGKGDMLFNPLGMGKPVRVQGTFISDPEVHRVIEYVKSQVDEAEYADDVMDTIENGNGLDLGRDDDADELLPDAIECVVTAGQASVSMLQRRFRIGYNRAARIVDMMESRGIVGPQDGSRPRQVLMTEEELEKLKEDTKGFN